MSKKLLIVESPAKAKTIEKILGKDFTVKSSYGHVRDLDKGNNAVDVQNDFKPRYIVSPEKTRVVKELKDLVKKVDEVWLATDEDREGEAISWHLCEVLGLDVYQTKRIVFTEITKPAILKAVNNPRNVNVDLVNAQQARRILDRLVGFELSELLWRKIKGKLSAGRVQSVSVKLVVEREREITGFETRPYFKVTADFPVLNDAGKTVMLQSELKKDLPLKEDARQFLESCVPASYKINDIEVKPAYRKPAPPFTTSTLQQEASRKLGFNVNRTMSAAQKLYEQGFITYMRTDSTSISEVALQSISNQIQQEYGARYLHVRRFKTKSESAQEAHEAIRPTYIENKNIQADRDMERLYELIWKRTIASQMSDAELERTIVHINISTRSEELIAEGEVMKFDGFLKVYLESSDDDEDDEAAGVLPPLNKGMSLKLNEMLATQKYTRAPARYTEAGLVKKLEELGIGRPSTYAPTISKIMEEERGYVIRDSRDGVERKFEILSLKDGKITVRTESEMTGAVKNRLFPTDMGMVVTDFLDSHFDQIMDYHFTADIEKQFDKIAAGQNQWSKMLKDFYFPFHELVQKTMQEADRASGERELGTDPESGRTVIVRISRFGKPIVQIGKRDELAEDESPKFANLKPGQSLESIELDEALKLFELPKTLGQYEDHEVSVHSGRFGPYIKYKELFVSLPRGLDPMSVVLETAIILIKEKLEADAPFIMYQGKPVTKGKGRFGPFLKWGDLYINVPVRFPLDTITEAQTIELIEAKVAKELTKYIQQWPEEKILIENGRWGPFIRFGKKMVKIGKKPDGSKYTNEDAATITLDEVKKMIEVEIPDAFAKKAAAKKPAAKSAVKKPAAKKTVKR
jgi:DNA topoisomerase-1